MIYNTKNLKKIGQKIKKKRMETKRTGGGTMSQEDLADATHMRSSHISLIERAKDREIYLSTILAICNALGIKVEELLNE